MTVTIFLGSLLIAMGIGIPIAFALLISGVALMWHLDLFDAQILAQNVVNGADSFPLLAVPFFMLAGGDHERGWLVQTHRETGAHGGWPCAPGAWVTWPSWRR